MTPISTSFVVRGAMISPGYVMPDYPGKPPFVEGVDGMRKAVRTFLRGGEDVVKLATTGGMVSEYDRRLVPDFTFEEIQAAVIEAGHKGKPVAANAYGEEGLTNAVRARVPSIEHAGFLTGVGR